MKMMTWTKIIMTQDDRTNPKIAEESLQKAFRNLTPEQVSDIINRVFIHGEAVLGEYSQDLADTKIALLKEIVDQYPAAFAFNIRLVHTKKPLTRNRTSPK